MSSSTKQIERDVERTRSDLEDTVEALKGKMSLGQMVDEAAGYMRASGGSEMMANLGTQVRANPIPLALVGIGLAWLMSGRGQPSMEVPSFGSSHRDDEEGDWGGDRYPRKMLDRRGDFGAAASVGPSAQYARPTADGGDDASSGRSALASAASGVGAAARQAGETASALGSRVSSAASSVGDAAASFGSSAGDGARHAGERARSAYQRGRSNAYSAGGQARRTFLDLLEQEPLIIGAIGIAVGAGIGAMLPSTRTEDRYLGGARDQLVDEGEEFLQEQLQRGTRVAEEAYRSAKEEVTSGDGGTLAEKAERAVKAGADAARSSAGSQQEGSAARGTQAGSGAGGNAAAGSPGQGGPAGQSTSARAGLGSPGLGGSGGTSATPGSRST